MTLDALFYEKQLNGDGLSNTRKWPEPQNPEENRKLFTESKSITYLENEAATIYLNAEDGPRTCFKVFGSPYTPNNRNWAFAYKPGTAQQMWDTIPLDTDIVVTHTPPLGHCDKVEHDARTGCGELSQALSRVRPMLSVFGHIHDARGVERVRWNLEGQTPANGGLTESVEIWQDPGIGKRQSMVNLSRKGRRPLDNRSRLTRQMSKPEMISQGGPLGRNPTDLPDVLRHVDDIGNNDASSVEEALGRVDERVKLKLGGAIECRQGPQRPGEMELGQQPDVEAGERRETVMINAAFCGAHHLKTAFNKPIVVDVDLPIWEGE